MNGDTLRDMLQMLTSSYARTDLQDVVPRTNIGRLFSIFGWLADSCKNTLETIREWDEIDRARGFTLDRYGANFGVVRDGTNDATYRVMIRIKILAQMSGGDIDTIITSAAGLLNIENTDVHLEELFPSKVRVTVPFDKVSEEHRQIIPVINKALKRIVAAGVGYELKIEKHRPCTFTAYSGVIPAVERAFELTPVFQAVPPVELRLVVNSATVPYHIRNFEIEVNP